MGSSGSIITLMTAFIAHSPLTPPPSAGRDAVAAYVDVRAEVVSTACCALVYQGCTAEAGVLARKSQERSFLPHLSCDTQARSSVAATETEQQPPGCPNTAPGEQA